MSNVITVGEVHFGTRSDGQHPGLELHVKLIHHRCGRMPGRHAVDHDDGIVENSSIVINQHHSGSRS